MSINYSLSIYYFKFTSLVISVFFIFHFTEKKKRKASFHIIHGVSV